MENENRKVQLDSALESVEEYCLEHKVTIESFIERLRTEFIDSIGY
jgi:hypothetical protein